MTEILNEGKQTVDGKKKNGGKKKLVYLFNKRLLKDTWEPSSYDAI